MMSPRRQLEKQISEHFLKYLEETGRQETMRATDLRRIYETEYETEYDTQDQSFKDIFHYMCYYMNSCQPILGNVVFGGGEEAALAMFTDDEDDEEEWDRERASYRFACDTCRRPMQDLQGLRQHEGSIKHRQQVILETIRNSLQRHQRDLTKDKKGIEVTSNPPASASGAIETIVQLQTEKDIVLAVKNIGDGAIELKDITLLWSTSSFNYKEIRAIPYHKSILYPGSTSNFSIGCKRRNEYGFTYVPAVLRFQEGGEEFYILRFLCVRYVSEIFEEIKKKSEYVGPIKHEAVPQNIETSPGLRLPALKKDGLKMDRLGDYFIDAGLRAQFKAYGAKHMRHIDLPSALRFEPVKVRAV